MERLRSKNQPQEGGSYFAAPSSSLRFIKSGCTMLDLVLGGGWPLGRMANIIGDKSTGKTLLAIEACANMARQYPKGLIWYRETEHAFDPDYARALGLPVERVDFGQQIYTVEEVAKDIKACVAESNKRRQPGLYIIDSLDALSSDAEMEREVGEATYGTEKAKAMSELFRKLNKDIETSEIHLLIVSQIRANIGVMFGDKFKRSGGAALDFYASQIIQLAHLKNLVAGSGALKRTTGIRVKVKCTKNKVWLPFRTCQCLIRFGYGVEDYEASLSWLIEANRTREAGLSKAKAEELLKESANWSAAELQQRQAELDPIVRRVWFDIEREFLPNRSKYA